MRLLRSASVARLIAVSTACLALAAGSLAMGTSGAAAATGTFDGVTTDSPELLIVSSVSHTRGKQDEPSAAVYLEADFTLRVAESTTLAEVRLSLRSPSVPGDSYDTGRMYNVTVPGERNFDFRPVVPDGSWTAAALWNKNGRWNSGPATSFTLSNGTVTLTQTPAVQSPTPVAVPATSPTATASPTAPQPRRGNQPGSVNQPGSHDESLVRIGGCG